MNNKAFSLCYETYGNPKNPCVLLITGIGAQLLHWPKLLIKGLVDKGYYVLIFDNRDSGLSKQYEELGTPSLLFAIYTKMRRKVSKKYYTLDDMASDVLMLLDHLSIEKAHILGISMGGMIAQLFALLYPNRIASLILVGTTSGDKDLPPAKPEVMQLFSIKSFNKRENEETYVANKSKLFKIYNPIFYNESTTHELLKKVYARAYTPNGLKRQMLATISAKPRGHILKQLEIKTLIIHGKLDPVFPIEHALFLNNCIPNSQLEIIENMGHLIPNELCEKIVQLIDDFIK